MRFLGHYRSFGLSLATALVVTPLTAQAQSVPSAYTYATRYDLQGRVTGTIAPDPDGGGALKYAAVRNTYDAVGRLVKVETGELSAWQSDAVVPASWGAAFSILSSVEATYDGLDRKTRELVKGSDGVTVSVTQYSYDSAGRLECTALRMNPAVFASLPSGACTLGTMGSQGPDRITKNLYDAAGQLLQVRRGVGTLLEIADATYTYTPNGKRKYVIDANGNKAELRYDGFDRQVRWVFPSPAIPSGYAPSTPANAVATAGALNESDYESYGYDANGNRTSLQKRDGSTLAFTFDALNRAMLKTLTLAPGHPDPGTSNRRPVYYGYDLQGRQLYARFDSTSGQGVTSAYDGFGRPTSTMVNLDGQSRQLSYLYDNDGNRTRITWPDGAYVTTGFDGMDRPASLTDGASSTLVNWAYNTRGLPSAAVRGGSAYDQGLGYDAAGRLSGLSITDGVAGSRAAWTFTRNPVGQVASEARDNDAYAWNGAQAVNRAYTRNGLNQYLTAGPASLCYDANGNLTADGSNVYLYDVENRLVEKRTQTNTACASLSYSGALQASLRYDPLGRLYEVMAGAITTRFLYDGDALVAEYNAAGALLQRYAHGSNTGVDDPLVWFQGTSALAANARHLYPDPRGSILLTGDAAGNAIAVNSYDEYGIPGSSNQGRFQYTGQAWLTELGMYYYKARIYSPALGRFLQVDPIGYDDQLNLYAYVANDPVNKTDFSGESWDDIVKAVKNFFTPPPITPPSATPSGTGGSRSTPPPPDPAAQGNPHTRVQSPGPNGRYTTYDEHGPAKQYRGEPGGKLHGEVPRPNVKEWSRNTAPDGKTYPGRPTVRAPTPGEIPAPRVAPAAAGGAAASGIIPTIIRFSPLGLLLLLSGDTPQNDKAP